MSKLAEKILEIGPEKCMFIVPMRPIRRIMGIGFTTSGDPEFDIPAKISQDRYKLEDDYKITLVSTLEGFGRTHYYLCDLESHIKRGIVKMYVETSIE